MLSMNRDHRHGDNIGGKIGVGGSVLIWKRNIVDKERITADW